jgi:hypothetical protein
MNLVNSSDTFDTLFSSNMTFKGISRGPATVLYDGYVAAVVYGPLQHEEPPPEATVPIERVGPPVWSTKSPRQSAVVVVVGRACTAFWPRLAATAENSMRQTAAAVQANMTADETNCNAILSCWVARVKRVRLRPVSLAFCRRDGVRMTTDGREPRTI